MNMIYEEFYDEAEKEKTTNCCKIELTRITLPPVYVTMGMKQK